MMENTIVDAGVLRDNDTRLAVVAKTMLKILKYVFYKLLEALLNQEERKEARIVAALSRRCRFARRVINKRATAPNE